MSDVDRDPEDLDPDGPFANLGALLAGPVIALQEAQIEAEKQVMEFILQYGLEDPPDVDGDETEGLQKLATLKFEMDQAVSDPQNAGSVVSRKAEVTVPVLSLMRLPGLQISDAKIDLAVELEESGQSQSTETRGGSDNGGGSGSGGGGRPRPGVGPSPGPGTVVNPGRGRPVLRRTTVSPQVLARLDKLKMTRDVKPVVGRITSRSNRSFRNRGKLNISLTVKSTNSDEIYDRLTRMMGDAITALADDGTDTNGDQG